MVSPYLLVLYTYKPTQIKFSMTYKKNKTNKFNILVPGFVFLFLFGLVFRDCRNSNTNEDPTIVLTTKFFGCKVYLFIWNRFEKDGQYNLSHQKFNSLLRV